MSRIAEHPVLGAVEHGEVVTFTYNGAPLEGYAGEPIAMALHAAGVMVHRFTAKRHEPRGVFCAIGRCTDCVMVVDGKPNVRTCMTPLAAGMDVRTQDGVAPLSADDPRALALAVPGGVEAGLVEDVAAPAAPAAAPAAAKEVA